MVHKFNHSLENKQITQITVSRVFFKVLIGLKYLHLMSVESKEENDCDYNSKMARGLKVIISKLR